MNAGGTDFIYTKLDREIWEEELEDFVPQVIFDAHTHLWSNAFVTPNTVCHNDWLEHETDFALLKSLSQVLYPGRTCDFLAFALPVIGADNDRLNEWVGSELKSISGSYGAMLVTPETLPQTIETMVRKHNFVALKPYHHFATAGVSGIKGYFTQEQMKIADALKLAVVLHCRSSIAEDVDELEEYAERYQGIRWVLAHCGSAFNPCGLENVVQRLAGISGIWFDTSAVCETYSQALLLKYFDRKRIMFGSDNALGVGGGRRGRVIACAKSVIWHKQQENTTFWMYEQLRAMRQACELLDVSRSEVEDVFYNNAISFFQKTEE